MYWPVLFLFYVFNQILKNITLFFAFFSSPVDSSICNSNPDSGPNSPPGGATGTLPNGSLTSLQSKEVSHKLFFPFSMSVDNTFYLFLKKSFAEEDKVQSVGDLTTNSKWKQLLKISSKDLLIKLSTEIVKYFVYKLLHNRWLFNLLLTGARNGMYILTPPEWNCSLLIVLENRFCFWSVLEK